MAFVIDRVNRCRLIVNEVIAVNPIHRFPSFRQQAYDGNLILI
ncbi:MAG: hypothetical protein ACM3H8_02760 [Sphingobacteriales bacterium]